MKSAFLACALIAATAMQANASEDSAYGCYGLEQDTDLATLEGKDGVFFRLGADIEMHRPFTDRTIEDMAKLSQALAARGTTLIFAPVPSKSVVMSDGLPERARLLGFDLEVSSAIQSNVIERLNSAGVLAVDLRKALLAAEPGRHSFFGTDTHWNAYGAELAARAIGGVLKAHEKYESLPKTLHETVEKGEVIAFSGMRRIIQRRCKETIPQATTMTYETRLAGSGVSAALDIGLGDADGVLDIGLDGDGDGDALDLGLEDEALPLDIGIEEEPSLDIGLGEASDDAPELFGDAQTGVPVALVGTSFTDIVVSNFPGFLAQHSDLEVVSYAITGGGQHGSIVSYLTSDDFQKAPPVFLIWENPIYTNLSQNGDQPFREMIAAGSGQCTQPLEFNVQEDRRGFSVRLPANLGPEHTLFVETANRAMPSATFRFNSSDGRLRTKSIKRGKRLRRNGRFYMPLTGLWSQGAQSVAVDVPLPLGKSPAVFYCPPTLN